MAQESSVSDALLARYPTPLRYPGGKQRLGRFFQRLVELNRLRKYRYVEPFCGGAGVAMFLLQKSLVESVHLNDVDRSIYAFWYAATKLNSQLCARIRDCEITVREWDRQKEVQRSKDDAKLLDLGFSTFFLNRANHSGILRGGIIGGRRQKGPHGISARFNKSVLIERVKQVGSLSSRITLSNSDVLASDDVTFGAGCTALVYFDPPYIAKGGDLYINSFTQRDHRNLAERIQATEHARWVVTYDDVTLARDAYFGSHRRFFALAHSADKYRIGREVMFFSQGLRVPKRISG